MAFTPQEESRIKNLEGSLTKVLAALQNVAPKKMLNQLLAVLTRKDEQLEERIAALESAVELLKSSR